MVPTYETLNVLYLIAADSLTVQPWSDTMHGSVSFGVGLSDTKKANLVSVSLQDDMDE